MPNIRKVAFVSPLSTAFVHRLIRGALSYAETCSSLIVRDFRLERGFHHSSGSEKILQKLLAWKPVGVLTILENEELDSLLQRLHEPCKVVSMCAVQRRPGVAVATGSFTTQTEAVVRHFRQQGLRSMFMLSLESEEQMQAPMGEVFSRIVGHTHGAPISLVEIIDPALLDESESIVSPIPDRLRNWLLGLPKPCGVYCPQLGGGGYVIRVCKLLGLRVPQDVSVVGTDDVDVSLASRPTLTSVTPVGEIIGFEALRLLDEILSGAPVPTAAVTVDAVDLHVRQSTGGQRAQVSDIAAAISHIHQHSCGGLSVASLLTATQQVSSKTFHTHFKTATGRTPGEAIRARQLDEACRLLSQTTLAVTLIAEKCGFSSSSDFARRFRATFNVAPSQYRLRSARF